MNRRKLTLKRCSKKSLRPRTKKGGAIWSTPKIDADITTYLCYHIGKLAFDKIKEWNPTECSSNVTCRRKGGAWTAQRIPVKNIIAFVNINFPSIIDEYIKKYSEDIRTKLFADIRKHKVFLSELTAEALVKRLPGIVKQDYICPEKPSVEYAVTIEKTLTDAQHQELKQYAYRQLYNILRSPKFITALTEKLIDHMVIKLPTNGPALPEKYLMKNIEIPMRGLQKLADDLGKPRFRSNYTSMLNTIITDAIHLFFDAYMQKNTIIANEAIRILVDSLENKKEDIDYKKIYIVSYMLQLALLNESSNRQIVLADALRNFIHIASELIGVNETDLIRQIFAPQYASLVQNTGHMRPVNTTSVILPASENAAGTGLMSYVNTTATAAAKAAANAAGTGLMLHTKAAANAAGTGLMLHTNAAVNAANAAAREAANAAAREAANAANAAAREAANAAAREAANAAAREAANAAAREAANAAAREAANAVNAAVAFAAANAATKKALANAPPMPKEALATALPTWEPPLGAPGASGAYAAPRRVLAPSSTEMNAATAKVVLDATTIKADITKIIKDVNPIFARLSALTREMHTFLTEANNIEINMQRTRNKIVKSDAKTHKINASLITDIRADESRILGIITTIRAIHEQTKQLFLKIESAVQNMTEVAASILLSPESYSKASVAEKAASYMASNAISDITKHAVESKDSIDKHLKKIDDIYESVLQYVQDVNHVIEETAGTTTTYEENYNILSKTSPVNYGSNYNL